MSPYATVRPRAAPLKTAFTHTERAIQSDRTMCKTTEGVLVERPSRRFREPMSRWPHQLLPEDHRLATDQAPGEVCARQRKDTSLVNPPRERPMCCSLFSAMQAPC